MNHGTERDVILVLVLDDLVVGALGQRSHKVVAALDITRPRAHARIADRCTVGLGNIELSVFKVLGEALLFGHSLDPLRVEAVLRIVKIDLKIEVTNVGVDRSDVVGQLHSDPLVAGKRGEQPSLGVVGDDNLVVGADALLVNQTADKLDALAGRCALAQDDARVAVLADAGIFDLGICFVGMLGRGIRCLGIVVVGGAQCCGAGDAPLIDAGLGVGIPASVPLSRMVAHVAVTIRSLGRGVGESGLVRAVGMTRAIRGLDAIVFEVTSANVLGAAVVRITVGRQLVAHIDLRAGERRGRHGHDGCSSKGEAYA